MRRERMRETASGVTTFATDSAVTVVAFPLAGRLFVAGLISGMARELVVDGPVFDPRPDPGGQSAGLRVRTTRCASPSSTAAAGSWRATKIPTCRGGRPTTSPARSSIATAATGGAPTARPSPHAESTWRRSSGGTSPNPAAPDQQPREVRYPAAGTPNAVVELHVLALDGGSIEVAWDATGSRTSPPCTGCRASACCSTVQSRDQRDLQVLEANPTTGDTAPIFTDHDDTWVELVPGTSRTSSTTDDW